ncbi:hypothetical protein DH2020_044963 [Rehmannia glutinosa]|uniref:UPF3 domain-containing protein n=1 Tax=Rehmannia glutinosa TaxID=99300 RepID=A0ABR0UH31_REHGL
MSLEIDTLKSSFCYKKSVLGFLFRMKGPLDRTKVVLRHLPPTISQSNLVEHVDSRFSGRYHWLAFRPGKSSPKHLTHSRAYINFNRPEDVIEFAEFLNGHVFVNEKGAQFKAIVEYAPSQCVPKQWSKKDGREGTILKDPEYLEFLEIIAKPVENLPSAEIQLERKEAERAGAPKDAPIVTPLMEFVRQKRVAKGGARRTMLNGKSSRRVSGISSKSTVSGSSKRGSEKRRTSTTMDSSKGVGGKDKSTYSLVPKHDDQQLTDNSATLASVSELMHLKGKMNANSDFKSGQGQKPPRPPSMQSFQKETNGVLEDKVVSNDLHAVHTEKQDRRMKNKDRPDRGVWTPLRRSEGSHASDDSLSSSASQTSQVDSAEGLHP